jgi:UDP-glucose 4-epimerase
MKTEVKKVLITGSSGYIGQHLCQMLSDEYQIYGIDKRWNVNGFRDPRDFYTKEITRIQDSMWSLGFEYFDTIIHLAALIDAGESVTAPIRYYETNLFGTLNILKYLRYNNFIFASSAAAENPVNPYGLSKRCAEDVVREHCLNNDKAFTIFRFYNVIGTKVVIPNNDSLFASLIKAERTGKFNLYGDDYDTLDGSCVRDYVHVNEICSAIKKAIEEPSGRVDNLGHGKGYSVKEIIEIFKRVNNCDFRVEVVPRREGDIVVSILKDVSPYMESKYTIEELLKV